MARIATEVETRAAGTLARVTIENQEKANCLTRALVDEIGTTFSDLARQEELRVVVLTGQGGRAFAAGANLQELGHFDAAEARSYITALQKAIQAVRDLPVPVVARINGACMGAGLELAAGCDLRVAADHALFSMPEVQLDLPSVIEAALLPRLVGWGRASWLLYRGDAIDATTAAQWGLVEKCVGADALDDAVEELVGVLMANGPSGMRLQKALMRQWERLPLDRAIAAGIDALALAYDEGDPRGRIRDMRGKRSRPAR